MTDAAMVTRDRVRRVVERDLRPVRPLWSPLRRVAVLAPIAVAVAALAASKYGLRHDVGQLGAVVTWGLSALEWTLGFVILGLALRQAVPGYGVSLRILTTGCVATAVLIVAATFMTYAIHPEFVPAAKAWRVWYLCLVGPLQIAAPLMIAAVALAVRATPTRPAAVGALCGVAAGIVCDSGWRLTCSFSAPAHVFGAHVLAVLLLAATGAMLGAAGDRARHDSGTF